MRTASQLFRNDILHWWAIFLLPVLLLLNQYFKPSKQNAFMCQIFWSTLPTLLFHRFKLSFKLFILANFSYNLILHFYYRGLPVCSVLACIANGFSYILLNFLPSIYTRSFTYVEFSIIVQPVIYYLVIILQSTFYLLGFTLDNNLYWKSETSLVCLVCFSSLLCILMLSEIRITSHLLKLLCYLLFYPAFLYCCLWNALAKEPLTWLLKLVLTDQTRITLFSVWLAILLATCIFVFLHTYHSSDSTTTVTRKLFHFSISMVYLFGIKYDVVFLEFCSKLLLFIFLYIEIIRLNNIYWISDTVNQVFDRFRDEKDLGLFTLTHIYLLIGCSTPLWLSSATSHDSKLLLASGVVTVGIGDTFASLGGFYWGKHKWPNSSKSYEGTVCSFVSQVVTLVCLQFWFNSASLLDHLSILKFIFISLTSSLVETFTVHVDNLILPLVQYTLILLLF